MDKFDKLLEEVDTFILELTSKRVDLIRVSEIRKTLLKTIDVCCEYNSNIDFVRIYPEKFIQDFCTLNNIVLGGVIYKNKFPEFIRPRQFLHRYLHKVVGFSSSETGRMIGNKNHATVLHSCKIVINEPDRFKFIMP